MNRNIYAISDLHLSFANPKPMDMFGRNWCNHAEKIATNWKNVVGDDDIVLLSGDFSWALRLEEALLDFSYLNNLPGTKIMIRGNHDYWWQSVGKVRRITRDDVIFLQNDSCIIDDIAFCGCRGWSIPSIEVMALYDADKKSLLGDETLHDIKIYKRELMRMRMALEHAKKRDNKKTIVLTHYPPFQEKSLNSSMTLLFEEYNVDHVVYGHIHTSRDNVFEGRYNNVEYHLASCDLINFTPIKIK